MLGYLVVAGEPYLGQFTDPVSFRISEPLILGPNVNWIFLDFLVL